MRGMTEDEVEAQPQEDGGQEDRTRLGTEAIEQLASGLNLAANTIKEFSQNSTADEESLKQLNDEQLFRLLEEAYHSKKLDEKNKSAIFKEILEDVHESLAAEKGHNSCSSGVNNTKITSTKRNHSTFDSIATLSEMMDPSLPSLRGFELEDNADSSSTKTEMEEMELDQLSDLEDKTTTVTKSLDENGNPRSSLRPLRPLSIYRHNPAFHSQHVSVNQVEDIIPPLSPTSLQPQQPPNNNNSTLSSSNSSLKGLDEPSSKFVRRKKKKADSIKAEDIDGFRGSDDLESLLQFIDGDKQEPAPGPLVVVKKQHQRARRSAKQNNKTPSKIKTKNSRTRSLSSESPVSIEGTSKKEKATSETTVKLVQENNNAKKTRNNSKSKKQAGFLVDLDQTFEKQRKESESNKKAAVTVKKEASEVPKQEIIKVKEESEEEFEEFDEEDFEEEDEDDDDISSTPVPQGFEGITYAAVVTNTVSVAKKDFKPLPPPPPLVQQETEVKGGSEDHIGDGDDKNKAVHHESPEATYNYASILKFIKNEWDIVTMEISNGSKDIQSKVVYYKAREKI